MTYDDLRALMPEIDARIAESCAAARSKHLARKGYIGAQARMEAALTAPFVLWLAHEIQRRAASGDRPRETAIGAAAGFGAFVMSLADNLVARGHQKQFIKQFLKTLENDLKMRLRDDPRDRISGGETIEIDLRSGSA